MSDLTRSPWLRAALLIGAVGLAVYGLVSQWTQVHAALVRLDGWDVAGATVCAIAGLGCMMLAWRALLADLGSSLPLPAAIRVMFVGQLGKYVPGAVWAVAAQVELARDYAVPRRRSATASLVSMAVTLVVGLVAAGLTLPLVSAHAVRQYWWVLAIIAAGGGVPVSAGHQVRPGPGAAGAGEGSAGGFGQPGRHGAGAGLDHARLALLRRARLVPDQRVRREGAATPSRCRSAPTRWPGRSAS